MYRLHALTGSQAALSGCRYGRGRSIALDIARGLAFLHAHGVIHSDIKSK